MCGCGVVHCVYEDEEWYDDGGRRAGLHWTSFIPRSIVSGVRREGRLSNSIISMRSRSALDQEEGGADERRRKASMTPRAALRLSSWWSPCSGQEAQIRRSGNDSSVVVSWSSRCLRERVGKFVGSHQCDNFLDYLLN